jgi:hypothetical protein
MDSRQILGEDNNALWAVNFYFLGTSSRDDLNKVLHLSRARTETQIGTALSAHTEAGSRYPRLVDTTCSRGLYFRL